jgi:hypothetical protein
MEVHMRKLIFAALAVIAGGVGVAACQAGQSQDYKDGYNAAVNFLATNWVMAGHSGVDHDACKVQRFNTIDTTQINDNPQQWMQGCYDAMMAGAAHHI